MKDEILEELWKVKDQIAAEAKGSTQALFERLRTVERESKIFNGFPRTRSVPSDSLK